MYKNDQLLFETPDNIMSMYQYSEDTFVYTTDTSIVVRKENICNTIPYSTVFTDEPHLRVNNI